MPNARVLEEKKQIVKDLAAAMKAAPTGVLVDYKGINVEDDTKLRTELRKAGVTYKVVKNTLLRLAVREIGYEGLEPHLEGTTAIAIAGEDMVAPARILHKFAQAAQKTGGTFSIKAGFIEGNVVGASDIAALAELPPKEVLIARALAGFNAPITGFVNVLNGNIRGLVVALNAIAEKKAA